MIMVGDFELRSALAAAVGSGAPDRAWGFVERFAARWARPLGPGDGSGESELLAVEERLGIGLPAAVRDAYLLFGRRDDLVRGQDRLVRPAHLDTDETGGKLVFRVEHGYVVEWGVPLGEGDDPPVLFRPTDEEEWSPFLDRFSLACVEMVLSECVLAPGAPGDNRQLDPVTLAALADTFPPLPLPRYPVWAAPDGPPVRWFGGDEVILRADGEDWMWARARDEAVLESVRAALPGVWLVGSAP